MDASRANSCSKPRGMERSSRHHRGCWASGESFPVLNSCGSVVDEEYGVIRHHHQWSTVLMVNSADGQHACPGWSKHHAQCAPRTRCLCAVRWAGSCARQAFEPTSTCLVECVNQWPRTQHTKRAKHAQRTGAGRPADEDDEWSTGEMKAGKCLVPADKLVAVSMLFHDGKQDRLELRLLNIKVAVVDEKLFQVESDANRLLWTGVNWVAWTVPVVRRPGFAGPGWK